MSEQASTELAKNEAIEDVQNNLFIHCPKVTFKLTRATKCSECNFFKSLMRVSDSSDQAVALRVVCAHPITRSLQVIDI